MKKIFFSFFFILLSISLFSETNKELTNKLVTAVSRGEIGKIERLLSQGAEIDGFNNIGITPLTMAVIRNNAAILELLLEKGANPALPALSGLTPLEYALSTNKAIYFRLLDAFLRQSSPYIGYLSRLVLQQKLDLLEEALGYGLDPNIQDKNGTSPLAFAVYFNHEETVKLLLNYNADPTLLDDKGHSALSIAQKMQLQEISKLLGNN